MEITVHQHNNLGAGDKVVFLLLTLDQSRIADLLLVCHRLVHACRRGIIRNLGDEHVPPFGSHPDLTQIHPARVAGDVIKILPNCLIAGEFVISPDLMADHRLRLPNLRPRTSRANQNKCELQNKTQTKQILSLHTQSLPQR